MAERSNASIAYSSYAVTNTTCTSGTRLASFRPSMPGIRMSRNARSGRAALSAASVSTPLRGIATISSC
ncbi:hypothetical protein DM45_3890 [Burkholderia mallei]|nr:hypothetical protein DM45_3890 [Burkholderia mallei]